VAKMMAKLGGAGEKVLYTLKVVKVNKRGKSQTRALLITEKALYNLLPTDYSKCKRRIPIESITAITTSKASDEFVIHVPDEYDYRFVSDKRDEIVNVLQKLHKSITKKKLKKDVVELKQLGELTITKDKAKLIDRDELQRQKRKAAEERHDSDDEEHKDTKGAVEAITVKGASVEKVSVESFDLLKVLGRGSFGKVMQVRKKDNGKIYAMKILKKGMLIARDQVEHTRAERKILEALQHPFLMGLRFAFQSPTKLYLVMDFYKGGELFTHLRNKKRFKEEEARIFVAEVGAGLGHLHSCNFIYRDLKPENILMDEDGHVCLTDFGLSKDVDPDNPEATTFCGTPEYLAPEILAGGAHGKAVDWWSLGILLYELTVGIPPFYSQNVNEMYHKIQHGVLRFPPFLSEECKSLVERLCLRDPSSRLGSSDRDFEDIKEHPFFASIDWDKLYKKQIDPPYKPKVKGGDGDTSLFDTTFTAEPVVDSVVPDSEIALAAGADGFSGFTYAGGSALQ